PAHNFLPNFQTFRLKDVTFFAIGISEQSNARRTVRIVFNRRYGRRNPGFVALEVDEAQFALMPAANEAHGHVARISAPARARLGFKQRLVRIPRRNVVVDQRRAVAQRLRRRSVCLDGHNQLLAVSFWLLAQFVVIPNRRSLPVRNLPSALTNSARTPASSRRPAAARTPSSSPDGSRRTSPAAAL